MYDVEIYNGILYAAARYSPAQDKKQGGNTVDAVDEYVSSFSGEKKEWLTELLLFVRDVYPDIGESFAAGMPTFQGPGFYIAFAAQKNNFSFYTNDTMILSMIKELLPGTSLGDGCARIQYHQDRVVHILIEAIKEIIDNNNMQRSTNVTDLKAAKKWAKINPDGQKIIVSNVFCQKCGLTTIKDYALHNDRYGFVIKGKCQKCGGRVTRFVEDL